MARNDYIKGISIELGADTTSLGKALKEVESQSRQLQGQLKDVNAQLKFDPKNTELLTQKQRLLADSINGAKEKLDILKEAEKQAQEQFRQGKISQEQYDALKREIIQTEQEIKKLEKSAETAGQKLADAGKKFSEFGGKTENLGKKLLPLSGVVIGIGVGSGKMASDFTDAMAKVSTIADETKVPIKDLEKQILDLSNQTGISANLVAEDVYNAISAGVDTSNAVDFLKENTKLAKGGFAETGQTLDILTTILNAYGMEAKDTSKISDMLIQTQNKGKVTVAELAESMGKVIPTAKNQNVALEQLTTSYVIMTSKGIKSAEATTYLNSMINELGKNGTTASDVLKDKTGKSFAELMKSGKSLGDVLKILDDEAKANGKSMNDMFGSVEASKSAITLLGDGVDNFNGQLFDMQKSTGATQKAFEKMQTPAEKLKIEINKLKNEGIKLGLALMPMLGKLTEALGKITEKIQSLSDEQLKTIINVGKVIAITAPLLIAIGKVATGIGGVMTVMSKLWALAMAHPLGALLTVVGLLTVATIEWVKNQDHATEETKKLRKQTDELNKTMDETRKTAETSAENFKKSADEIFVESEMAKKLTDELYKLNDKANKTNEEKEKMKSLVQQLNDIYPDLNLKIDTENGHLNTQKETVMELIEKHQKLAYVKAAEERMVELAKEQIKHEMELKDIRKLQNDLIEERTEKEKELKRYLDISNKSVEEQNEFYKTHGIKNIRDMNQNIDILTGLIKKNNDSINLHTLELDKNGEKMEEVSEIVSTKGESMAKIHKENYDSMNKDVDAFTTNTKDKLNSGAEEMKNIGTKYPQNLSTGMTSETDTVNTAAQGLTASAIAGLNMQMGEFHKIGVNMGDGVNNGILSTFGKIGKSAVDLGINIVKNMQKTMDIHSPSRVMKKMVGIPIAQGVGVGFTEQMQKEINVMSNALPKELPDFNATMPIKTQSSQTQTIQQAMPKNIENFIFLDSKQIAESVTPFVSNTIKNQAIAQSRRSGGVLL